MAGRPAPAKRARSNQPYYAYRNSGSYTLTLANAPRAVRLTEAGGYAPVGASVGTVTVRNLRTQAEGRTEYLGRGIAVGRLSPPVPVKRRATPTRSAIAGRC